MAMSVGKSVDFRATTVTWYIFPICTTLKIWVIRTCTCPPAEIFNASQWSGIDISTSGQILFSSKNVVHYDLYLPSSRCKYIRCVSIDFLWSRHEYQWAYIFYFFLLKEGEVGVLFFGVKSRAIIPILYKIQHQFTPYGMGSTYFSPLFEPWSLNCSFRSKGALFHLDFWNEPVTNDDTGLRVVR